jgi:hypothetical protein
MRLSGTTPSSQLPGRRPISFLLDNGGSIGAPVTLTIRPEDLTRNEPARATVYQTLGREVSGWVDHFGEGLPSVSISGHTGWRDMAGSGTDGAAAFAKLNHLVVRDFPAAKQAAIDSGRNPGGVKLLFVDMLDDFVWSVAPTQFTLRRNKSSPLLYRYNINLQAVSTSIDSLDVMMPFFGGIPAGLNALDRAIATIAGMSGDVEGWVMRALNTVDRGLGPIAAIIKNFVGLSNTVFGAVNGVVRSASNFVTGLSNRFIAMAGDVAIVGRNIFRTINAIVNLPADLKASLGRVASAFNEVACIFKNSLRPRKTYEDYTGMYGASNCSSTTGGRQESAYANLNAFQQMQADKDVATANSAALAGISALSRTDPVLAPMPIQEVGRHVTNIVTGLAL